MSDIKINNITSRDGNSGPTIAGVSTTFDWYENSNYIQVPPSVIGVFKVFHFVLIFSYIFKSQKICFYFSYFFVF